MTTHTFPQSFPSSDNAQMTLSQEGSLFILHLHHKDNQFNTEFCRAILAALQVIEDTYVLAEILRNGFGYFRQWENFSNGLELAEVVQYAPFMDLHAFAGGCLFALAHDYRVMRSD
ncbi:unnamed protein product [Absidia cylindrospora]